MAGKKSTSQRRKKTVTPKSAKAAKNKAATSTKRAVAIAATVSLSNDLAALRRRKFVG